MMTRPEFDAQMTRLASLPGLPSQIDTHWDALRDIPGDVFAAAVAHVARTAKWFPVPSALREAADVVRRRMPVEAPAPVLEELAEPLVLDTSQTPLRGVTLPPVTRIWRFYCEDCSDLGVVDLWCGSDTPPKPWYERSDCHKTRQHDPHHYVRTCLCVDSNPKLVAERRAKAEYATHAADKGARM